MGSTKKILILFSSLSAVVGVLIGVNRAIHSDLFTVQVVEVIAPMVDAPLDKSAILHIAAIPVGRTNLFGLDLEPIERRLLSHDWIQEARIFKKLPRTIVIRVGFRKPKAVIQTSKGALSYVDSDGRPFGSVNLTRALDLPLFFGLANQSPERIRMALQLLDLWDGCTVHETILISSVYWDSERGFRILVTYPLKKVDPRRPPPENVQVRTMVDFGQKLEVDLEGKLNRLMGVLRYLSENSIVARQILADAEKKIVVKTAHGS